MWLTGVCTILATLKNTELTSIFVSGYISHCTKINFHIRKLIQSVLQGLAGAVQIAQLVTADSYPSTPYCLPIPSVKFPINRC